MTKSDFEFIASVLAYGENLVETAKSRSENPEMDEYISGGNAMLNELIGKFADELSASHPRFKSELFKLAARPVATKRHRDAILKSLETSDA